MMPTSRRIASPGDGVLREEEIIESGGGFGGGINADATVKIPKARHTLTERWSLAEAERWADLQPAPRHTELVGVDRQAVARILADDIAFPEDFPACDMAVADGYALHAAETIGAGGYNPLYLAVRPPGQALREGEAAFCNAGDHLPEGADAILPPDAADARGGLLELTAAVRTGQGIARRGQTARRGERALARGRPLTISDIALLSTLGVGSAQVMTRPLVGLLIHGPKSAAGEALAEALGALASRDGGEVRLLPHRQDMAQAVKDGAGCDLLVVVGRSGWGEDDRSAEDILRAGGQLAQHGLAFSLAPSAGFGALRGVPLVLLPGDPLAALASFDLLAGRIIRRFAGLPRELPYARREVRLTRKISSPIGTAQWVPLRCRGNLAEPLPLSPAGGLTTLGLADAFLIVPPELEGYDRDAPVKAYVTMPVFFCEEGS